MASLIIRMRQSSNLTNHSLSYDELEVLKLGLRYGLATRPNQLEIMAMTEDIWRQISRLDIFKQGRYVQELSSTYRLH